MLALNWQARLKCEVLAPGIEQSLRGRCSDKTQCHLLSFFLFGTFFLDFPYLKSCESLRKSCTGFIHTKAILFMHIKAQWDYNSYRDEFTCSKLVYVCSLIRSEKCNDPYLGGLPLAAITYSMSYSQSLCSYMLLHQSVRLTVSNMLPFIVSTWKTTEPHPMIWYIEECKQNNCNSMGRVN